MEQILLGFQEEILILSVWLVEREDLQVGLECDHGTRGARVITGVLKPRTDGAVVSW